MLAIIEIERLRDGTYFTCVGRTRPVPEFSVEPFEIALKIRV